MRFTIRHLLWFTLLAAVGCWWWMPSSNDAKVVEDCSDSDFGDGLLRFNSLVSVQQWLIERNDGGNISGELNDAEKEIDFITEDVLVVSHHSDQRTTKPQTVPQRVFFSTRGHGLIVLAHQRDRSVSLCSLTRISKHAQVFEVSEAQISLIDVSVAAGLLTLAIGSLFVGRRKIPLQ